MVSHHSLSGHSPELQPLQPTFSEHKQQAVVWTNEICVPAQHTYESVGFQFVKKSEETFSEYAGQPRQYGDYHKKNHQSPAIGYAN